MFFLAQVIDEDQTVGINPTLILAPLLAPTLDLGPELFGGQHAFLKLIPSAWKNSHIERSSTFRPHPAISVTGPGSVKSRFVR